ncbi:hypothetical protein GPECTOR_62g907 [Gonium pectorale]|uniref:Uncharacterized protein n=1 Tax=Gonium pectorale TaxID=33097 RepID=A0A150G4K6_GONPE|nr:hypothetical protein GPECTOR_62g907 [Gonium pectorale]|eukprot:KXZ44792.1 hypothetical protein GPECTOR_62g907 [Gonium pectorale]
MSSSYQPLAHQDNSDSEGAPVSQVDALAEPYAALAKHGEWSTGFFDCCGAPGGTGLCCTSTFLPCVQYGYIVDELPQVSSINQVFSRNSDGVICGGSFWGGCLTYCALCWCGNFTLGAGTGLGQGGGFVLPCQVPLHLQLRVHMRKKYGIQAVMYAPPVVADPRVYVSVPPSTSAGPVDASVPVYGTPMGMAAPPPVVGTPVVVPPGKHD